MDKNGKIFVAGATGMVGSAVVDKLVDNGFNNIIGSYNSRKIAMNQKASYQQINLLDTIAVKDFFEQEKPEYVFLAAAKVGGIIANNTYRAQFLYENLQIQNNIIHQSYLSGVKKLLFLGSSCIYPRNCPQPMKEEYLLTSELEYTNEPYAIAKIAGIKMCESYNLQYGTNFISVMPTNLYGKNDNFDLENSHVLPALIRKMHLGKCLASNDYDGIRSDFEKRPFATVDKSVDNIEVINILEKYGIYKSDKDEVTIKLWGSGAPKREFLHATDLADACVHIMEKLNYKDMINNTTEIRNTHINIGVGNDLSIKNLALLIKDIVGFNGQLEWDNTKPDGTMQKLMDVSKLKNYGWEAKIDFKDGITKVYQAY